MRPRSAATSGAGVPPAPPDALLHTSRTPAYLEALARLGRYAQVPDLPVLITGETGVGKTLFAHHLHACSARATGPFVDVSMAAMDDALSASALFGHVRGAFTGADGHRVGAFARAVGGTLFLDEISRASRTVQGMLLTAVEEHRITPVGSDHTRDVDVRIVAATNVPLQRLVDDGSFFPDLAMRLDVLRVHIPSLRERAHDIPILLPAMVARRVRALGGQRVPAIDPALADCLVQASWPGNLRQLEGVVAALLADAAGDDRLSLCHLPARMLAQREEGSSPGTERLPDRRRVSVALALAQGNKADAARRLGVSRNTLYRWLEQEVSEGEPSGT